MAFSKRKKCISYMPPKEPHIHKYIRVKLGVRKVLIEYKCALPGCRHHLAKDLVVGRRSLCNYCGKEFYMDKGSIRLAKPHCGCISKRDVTTEKTIEDFLMGKL